MTFDYAAIVADVTDDGDYLVIFRPEIRVTIAGPSKSADYIGLVDTGSDHTILPLSAAELLGISVHQSAEQPANVFGGQQVTLLVGQATLKLEANEESVEWTSPVHFFDFAADSEETVVLGHSGFLDYFTATFDGRRGTLTLIPNEDLPGRCQDDIPAARPE